MGAHEFCCRAIQKGGGPENLQLDTAADRREHNIDSTKEPAEQKGPLASPDVDSGLTHGESAEQTQAAPEQAAAARITWTQPSGRDSEGATTL